jgi:hypothetical protein
MDREVLELLVKVMTEVQESMPLLIPAEAEVEPEYQEPHLMVETVYQIQ